MNRNPFWDLGTRIGLWILVGVSVAGVGLILISLLRGLQGIEGGL